LIAQDSQLAPCGKIIMAHDPVGSRLSPLIGANLRQSFSIRLILAVLTESLPSLTSPHSDSPFGKRSPRNPSLPPLYDTGRLDKVIHASRPPEHAKLKPGIQYQGYVYAGSSSSRRTKEKKNLTQLRSHSAI
jgi:hypothetical protein